MGTRELDPEQLRHLRQLVQSGYLPTIEESAKRMTAPFWWYDPARPDRTIIKGGTICFVHTGERLLGITAAHVHGACVDELRKNPAPGCQIGGHTFEPEKHLLSLDERVDLATYSLSEIQVAAARADVHYAPVWPPLINEEDVHIIGGWPWVLSVDGHGDSTHYFLNFAGKLSGTSDRHIGFATHTSTSVPWGGHAIRPGTNLGGMSGGPLYRVTERGLSTMTLVGITYEYQPSFELALARPLSLVNADGSVAPPN